jgi:cysteinyl-tRNA synthetase
MALRIHNTLTRRIEPFTPIEPGRVRMYVCGITVYDLCHIGHARFVLVFDMVYRWLRASGFDVTYARNVTDIDDKIIRRALERGIPIRQLTEEMTAAMHADFAALGMLPPTHEPRATAYVPQMLAMIERLEHNGLAYRSASGDVNFAVRKFPGYGKLSGKSIDQLRSGERVAVDDGKDDPLDFVLWKAAKDSEPEDAKWDAPFGRGRPGWHIECSAMGCTLLGDTFDIHGGGLDLTFPHHENEIAQSEGANGKTFVNLWMHNGFLNVDDTKMSKSLGNFFTIRDVVDKQLKGDGETLRFFMLRTHYRSPFNYSGTNLDDAKAALKRLYTALHAVPAADVAIDWSEPRAAAFRAAMDDDFNTPEAFAVLFDLAGEVNRTRSAATAGLLKALAGTLGLLQQDPRAWLQGGVGSARASGVNATVTGGLTLELIEGFITQRAAAKRERNFAEADRIRRQLQSEGIVLKDGPQGTTWERA